MRPKASNFDTWAKSLESRPAPAAPLVDPALGSKLTATIAKAAASYTPKAPPSFHFEVPAELSASADYHQVLEESAVAQLKGWLGMTLQQPLHAQLSSFTTSDVDAALQLAGVTVDSKTGKDAVLVLVAAETERQMSWSRLESLIMHWATTQGPGTQWEMPAAGWKSFPDVRQDAGGAWQCSFEKLALPGTNNQCMYTLIMQVPLVGPLATGGLTFVLKSDSGNQDTRWLKDAKTKKDFYLDLNTFPHVSKK